MSNQYIVKFIKDASYSESSTYDGFLELISDNGCPTIFIRTCKESSDPKNVNLLNLYVTKNMGKFNFDHHTLTCTINSQYRYYKIVFDSSSSSAFTDFQRNFETALNSKFDSEYYPKSGNLKYVGEVVYTKIDFKNIDRGMVPNGKGTLYYDKPGQKIRYQGEFSEGNFDGAGKFYSSDGRVVLTANNISNGVPVQKGKLEINFGKQEVIEIKFTELWSKLNLNDKDSVRSFVLSDEFIDEILINFWDNKDVTIEEAKFKYLPEEDKQMVIYNQLKDLRKYMEDTRKIVLKENRENFSLSNGIGELQMFIIIVSLGVLQVVLRLF
jgi:hypothetical protein